MSKNATFEPDAVTRDVGAAFRVQRAWRRYKARYTLERYRYERHLDALWTPERLMCLYADVQTQGIRSSLGPTASVRGRHLDFADPLSSVDLTSEVVGDSDGPLAATTGRVASAQWQLRRAAAGQAAISRFLVDRAEVGAAALAECKRREEQRSLAKLRRRQAAQTAALSGPDAPTAALSPGDSEEDDSSGSDGGGGGTSGGDERRQGGRQRGLPRSSEPDSDDSDGVIRAGSPPAGFDAGSRGKPAVAAGAWASRRAAKDAGAAAPRLRVCLSAWLCMCADAALLPEHRAIRDLCAAFRVGWEAERAERRAAKAQKAAAALLHGGTGKEGVKQATFLTESVALTVTDGGGSSPGSIPRSPAQGSKAGELPVWHLSLGPVGFRRALLTLANDYLWRAYGIPCDPMYAIPGTSFSGSGGFDPHSSGAAPTPAAAAAASSASMSRAASALLLKTVVLAQSAAGVAKEGRKSRQAPATTGKGNGGVARAITAAGWASAALLTPELRISVFLSECVWPAAQRRWLIFGGYSPSWQAYCQHIKVVRATKYSVSAVASRVASVIGVPQAPSTQPSAAVLPKRPAGAPASAATSAAVRDISTSSTSIIGGPVPASRPGRVLRRIDTYDMLYNPGMTGSASFVPPAGVSTLASGISGLTVAAAEADASAGPAARASAHALAALAEAAAETSANEIAAKALQEDIALPGSDSSVPLKTAEPAGSAIFSALAADTSVLRLSETQARLSAMPLQSAASLASAAAMAARGQDVTSSVLLLSEPLSRVIECEIPVDPHPSLATAAPDAPPSGAVNAATQVSVSTAAQWRATFLVAPREVVATMQKSGAQHRAAHDSQPLTVSSTQPVPTAGSEDADAQQLAPPRAPAGAAALLRNMQQWNPYCAMQSMCGAPISSLTPLALTADPRIIGFLLRYESHFAGVFRLHAPDAAAPDFIALQASPRKRTLEPEELLDGCTSLDDLFKMAPPASKPLLRSQSFAGETPGDAQELSRLGALRARPSPWWVNDSLPFGAPFNELRALAVTVMGEDALSLRVSRLKSAADGSKKSGSSGAAARAKNNDFGASAASVPQMALATTDAQPVMLPWAMRMKHAREHADGVSPRSVKTLSSAQLSVDSLELRRMRFEDFVGALRKTELLPERVFDRPTCRVLLLRVFLATAAPLSDSDAAAVATRVRLVHARFLREYKAALASAFQALSDAQTFLQELRASSKNGQRKGGEQQAKRDAEAAAARRLAAANTTRRLSESLAALDGTYAAHLTEAEDVGEPHKPERSVAIGGAGRGAQVLQKSATAVGHISSYASSRARLAHGGGSQAAGVLRQSGRRGSAFEPNVVAESTGLLDDFGHTSAASISDGADGAANRSRRSSNSGPKAASANDEQQRKIETLLTSKVDAMRRLSVAADVVVTAALLEADSASEVIAGPAAWAAASEVQHSRTARGRSESPDDGARSRLVPKRSPPSSSPHSSRDSQQRITGRRSSLQHQHRHNAFSSPRTATAIVASRKSTPLSPPVVSNAAAAPKGGSGEPKPRRRSAAHDVDTGWLETASPPAPAQPRRRSSVTFATAALAQGMLQASSPDVAAEASNARDARPNLEPELQPQLTEEEVVEVHLTRHGAASLSSLTAAVLPTPLPPHTPLPRTEANSVAANVSYAGSRRQSNGNGDQTSSRLALAGHRLSHAAQVPDTLATLPDAEFASLKYRRLLYPAGHLSAGGVAPAAAVPATRRDSGPREAAASMSLAALPSQTTAGAVVAAAKQPRTVSRAAGRVSGSERDRPASSGNSVYNSKRALSANPVVKAGDDLDDPAALSGHAAVTILEAEWNALGPLMQEVQHAAHLAKGAKLFRAGGRSGVGLNASSVSVSRPTGMALDEIASAAVQRAGHLRRVLLALPRPEPLPRITCMFASSNSSVAAAMLGPAAAMEDPLAVALGRGLSTVTATKLTDQVTGNLVSLLQDAGTARYVSRPGKTVAIAYSVPAIEASLALDDSRCLLRGPREALRKAVAEAGRRHLLYTHHLRVAARDLFLAVERGEFTRASLLVGGQRLALKRGSSAASVNAASSLKALSSIGAGRATMGVSLRRSSAGSAMSMGTTMEHEHPGANPAGAAEAAAIAAAGLGSLQLDPRLPVRITIADLPDMLAAAGIALPDDTELRYVLSELGLDYESLALAHGTPRARDLSGASGAIRVGSLLAHAPSFVAAAKPAAAVQAAVSETDEEEDNFGLAVAPRPLSQLYNQPPVLEGGELEPVYRSLLKRDRDLVTAALAAQREEKKLRESAAAPKRHRISASVSPPPSRRLSRDKSVAAGPADGDRRTSRTYEGQTIDGRPNSSYSSGSCHESSTLASAAAGTALDIADRRSASAARLSRDGTARPASHSDGNKRSASVGVLQQPRSAAAGSGSSGFGALAQDTVASQSRPPSSNDRRPRSIAAKRDAKAAADAAVEQMRTVALARTQAAHDAVLRYASQLVLSEESVAAIAARVLKLRFRVQRTLMCEGQFVFALGTCAAYGLIDVAATDRRLALRQRFAAVQRRVRNLVGNVDLMAHYRAVMPAPPDIDLPYWERLLSSLLERVYRTYALLADPLAFQPLLMLKLEQLQQDAAGAGASGAERIDAILTGGGADPILAGSHLHVMAAASFAIDCRLFTAFLSAAPRMESNTELPIGGVLQTKPADDASRKLVRLRMEERALGVLLRVLKHRQELPLMHASFRWPHSYTPLPGLRNAPPAVQAEDAQRKIAAVMGNLESLTLPALSAGRIGFRIFRAFMLQLLQCEYECRGGTPGDEAFLHPRGRVPPSFLPLDAAALPHPPMKQRDPANARLKNSVAPKQASPSLPRKIAKASSFGALRPAARAASPQRLQKQPSLMLQAQIDLVFEASVGQGDVLPEAPLLPALPFSYELPQPTEDRHVARDAGGHSQLQLHAGAQQAGAKKGLQTSVNSDQESPGRRAKKQLHRTVTALVLSSDGVPQRLARCDPILWTIVQKPYDAARFSLYARRMSRLGISNVARAHILGEVQGGFEVMHALVARREGKESHLPKAAVTGVDVTAAEPADEDGGDGGIGPHNDDHLQPPVLDSPPVMHAKCVSSPLLWSMMTALLPDEYNDAQWDGRRHRPRIDYVGAWPPEQAGPDRGPALASLPARLGDGISPYAACLRWAVCKLWRMTVLYEPLRLGYAAQRVLSVAKHRVEAAGAVLINETEVEAVMRRHELETAAAIAAADGAEAAAASFPPLSARHPVGAERQGRVAVSRSPRLRQAVQISPRPSAATTRYGVVGGTARTARSAFEVSTSRGAPHWVGPPLRVPVLDPSAAVVVCLLAPGLPGGLSPVARISGLQPGLPATVQPAGSTPDTAVSSSHEVPARADSASPNSARKLSPPVPALASAPLADSETSPEKSVVRSGSPSPLGRESPAHQAPAAVAAGAVQATGMSPRLSAVPALPALGAKSGVPPHFLDPGVVRMLQLLRVSLAVAAAENARRLAADEAAAEAWDAAATSPPSPQRALRRLSLSESGGRSAADGRSVPPRRRTSVAEFPQMPASGPHAKHNTLTRRISITTLAAAAPPGVPPSLMSEPQAAEVLEPAACSNSAVRASRASLESVVLPVTESQSNARSAARRISEAAHDSAAGVVAAVNVAHGRRRSSVASVSSVPAQVAGRRHSVTQQAVEAAANALVNAELHAKAAASAAVKAQRKAKRKQTSAADSDAEASPSDGEVHVGDGLHAASASQACWLWLGVAFSDKSREASTQRPHFLELGQVDGGGGVRPEDDGALWSARESTASSSGNSDGSSSSSDASDDRTSARAARRLVAAARKKERRAMADALRSAAFGFDPTAKSGALDSLIQPRSTASQIFDRATVGGASTIGARAPPANVVTTTFQQVLAASRATADGYRQLQLTLSETQAADVVLASALKAQRRAFIIAADEAMSFLRRRCNAAVNALHAAGSALDSMITALAPSTHVQQMQSEHRLAVPALDEPASAGLLFGITCIPGGVLRWLRGALSLLPPVVAVDPLASSSPRALSESRTVVLPATTVPATFPFLHRKPKRFISDITATLVNLATGGPHPTPISVEVDALATSRMRAHAIMGAARSYWAEVYGTESDFSTAGKCAILGTIAVGTVGGASALASAATGSSNEEIAVVAVVGDWAAYWTASTGSVQSESTAAAPLARAPKLSWRRWRLDESDEKACGHDVDSDGARRLIFGIQTPPRITAVPPVATANALSAWAREAQSLWLITSYVRTLLTLELKGRCEHGGSAASVRRACGWLPTKFSAPAIVGAAFSGAASLLESALATAREDERRDASGEPTLGRDATSCTPLLNDERAVAGSRLAHNDVPAAGPSEQHQSTKVTLPAEGTGVVDDVPPPPQQPGSGSSSAASYYLKLLTDMAANPTVTAALAAVMSPALKQEVIAEAGAAAGRAAAVAARAKLDAAGGRLVAAPLHPPPTDTEVLALPLPPSAAAARSGFQGRRYSNAAAAAREAAEAAALAAAVHRAANAKAVAAAAAEADARERSRLARLLEQPLPSRRLPASVSSDFQPRIGANVGFGVTFKVVASAKGPVVQGIQALSPPRRRAHNTAALTRSGSDAVEVDEAEGAGSSETAERAPASSRPHVPSLARSADTSGGGGAEGGDGSDVMSGTGGGSGSDSDDSLILLRKDPSGAWEGGGGDDVNFAAHFPVPKRTAAAQVAVAIGKAMTGSRGGGGHASVSRLPPAGAAGKSNEVRGPSGALPPSPNKAGKRRV